MKHELFAHTKAAMDGQFGNMSIRHSAIRDDILESFNERLNSIEQFMSLLGVIDNGESTLSSK